LESYVEHYNNVRRNSAVGYITPKDMLDGRQQEIHAEIGSWRRRGNKQIPRQSAALCTRSITAHMLLMWNSASMGFPGPST